MWKMFSQERLQHRLDLFERRIVCTDHRIQATLLRRRACGEQARRDDAHTLGFQVLGDPQRRAGLKVEVSITIWPLREVSRIPPLR